MGRPISFHQFFVLATAAIAISVFAFIVNYESPSQARTVEVSEIQPMIGSPAAPVEMIVFEDFQCGGCRAFHDTIFPVIRAEYIEAGTVRCRFIPLGFLKGSKPLANAALAVYALSPDRFPLYASALFGRFERKGIERDQVAKTLIELAAEVGGIDMDPFRGAVRKGLYYQEVDQNLGIAKTVMGKQFRLPAVYVNGIAGPTQNLQALQKLIEAAQ